MSDRIRITKSECADTRTCDWSKVTEDQLLTQSKQHIGDVMKGMSFFALLLCEAAQAHDRTKISHIHQFWQDFKTGFKSDAWWKMHQRDERHHFNTPEYVRDDINLIDVLEQIVDGVMAGLARSGKYRHEPLSNELLQKAYENTAKLLIAAVDVVSPAWLRGHSDCVQDRFENVPFVSVGGLACRTDMRVPQYVKLEEAADYLSGYSVAAAEMFGPDWMTAEFAWRPAMTIGQPANPPANPGSSGVCEYTPNPHLGRNGEYYWFRRSCDGEWQMDYETFCPGCGRRVEVRK